jgi:hypothetical protein
MTNLIFLFIFISLFSQDPESYYLKVYGNSYRQVDLFIDEDYEYQDQENHFIFNTYSVDFTYRFTNIYQMRVIVPMVNVVHKNEDRFELTDLWTEFHYYFDQYPNKMYIGTGLKLPLGYDEAKDPWLSDGSVDMRLIFLMKQKFNSDSDFEIDIKYDMSLTETERINSGGYRIPYFFSLSFYDNEFTYLPVISGAFKSYEYKSGNEFGDRYNEFALDVGFIVKYKLKETIEMEIAYSRTLFGFQSPVANHFGLGIAFGIRD